MTTAPARPTFTPDARGHYPCPHPACRQTFTRKQGVSRHWGQQHEAFVGDDPGLDDLMDEQPTHDVDDLHRRLYPEAYDEHGNPLDDDQDDNTTQAPPAEAHDHQDHPTLGADDTGVEEPDGQVEAPPAPPCPSGGPRRTIHVDVTPHLLTPAQVLDRATHAYGEQLLDVAYALDILAGATGRLVAAGMDPTTAWEAITTQTQQHLTRGTAA